MKSEKWSYLGLMATFSLFGSMYVVTKIALHEVPAVVMLTFRFVISSILLLIVCRVWKTVPIEKKDIKQFVLIGFLGYFVSNGMLLLGIQLSNSSVSSLIHAMNPIFITFFAWLILKETIGVHKIISVILAVAGSAVIIGASLSGGILVGVIVSIISMLLWAFVTILIRRLTLKYPPLQVTAYGMAISAVCSLPFSIYTLATSEPINWRPSLVLMIFYVAVFCTALAHMLLNISLSHIQASTCSLFYPLQPMVSVLLGWLILKEKPEASFLIGSALILIGFLISLLPQKKNTALLLESRAEEQKIPET